MSSGNASTSKAPEPAVKSAEVSKEEQAQPTLGVLEEDDEFEEFPVAGMYIHEGVMEYYSWIRWGNRLG